LKLRWTPRAVADLEQIADYLLAVHPQSWDRLLTRVEETVDYLLHFPHMGKAGLVEGTREFVLSGTPYILVFRIKHDVVQMVSVRDGRMQLPPSY
jgi:toxin ParE1/3/4